MIGIPTRYVGVFVNVLFWSRLLLRRCLLWPCGPLRCQPGLSG